MGVDQSHCFHGIVTFRELAENDLNNIHFAFLDPASMHRCLETGNAGKEKIGVLVSHELNSLQLRPKQMPLGWLKGQRPLSHCPHSIRNGVTLIQTVPKRSTSSRFGNVPPYPSVVCDKGLAKMSKEVCVVKAADYSYFRSVFAIRTSKHRSKQCIRMEDIPRGISVQYPEEHTANLGTSHHRYSPHVSTSDP